MPKGQDKGCSRKMASTAYAPGYPAADPAFRFPTWAIALIAVIGLAVIVGIIFVVSSGGTGTGTSTSTGTRTSTSTGTGIVTFSATLTGEKEVPPRPLTQARAVFDGVLNGSLVYSFRITQQPVSGTTMAHIHRGARGVNGPIVKTLIAQGQGDQAVHSGVWSPTDVVEPLTPELRDELLAGGLYINLHSAEFPAGEIRAQLIPTGTATGTAAAPGTGTATGAYLF